MVRTAARSPRDDSHPLSLVQVSGVAPKTQVVDQRLARRTIERKQPRDDRFRDRQLSAC
jgi:hypothetical protein